MVERDFIHLMNFKDLGLQPALWERCEKLGFTTPTPVQEQAIPIILDGNDIIGTAETGTGKTAAFLLPILQKLMLAKKRPGTTVLILSPTRELANQTEAACKRLGSQGNNLRGDYRRRRL